MKSSKEISSGVSGELHDGKEDTALWREALCLLLLLGMVTFFLRTILFSDRMIGDSGDARLNTFFAEQWYRIFQGKAEFGQLPVFYPVENTGAYSDLCLAFALPYSILRLFGMDMFLAEKIVLMLFFYAGTLGCYFLLRKGLAFGPEASLTGTMLAELASNVQVRMPHTQFMMLKFVPFLLMLLLGFVRAVAAGNKKKRRIYGISSVLLLVLIFYSSFYTGYFCILFLGIWVLCMLGADGRYLGRNLGRYWAIIKKDLPEYIVYAALFCVTMIPFLQLYIPASKEYSRHWEHVVVMLPSMEDWVNVSTSNLFYGELVRQMKANNSVEYAEELSSGFPLITLAFMLVAGAWLLRRDRRKEERRDDRYTGIYYFKVTAIAVLVCWLLLLRVGDMSLWRLVFELVPGGKALRAISRFQVFLSFPIGIVCGAYMEELSAAADKTESKKKGIVLHLAMVAFILFLYAENSLKNGCPAYWNRGEQLAYLESVPQPPEECRTFCIYEDAEVSPERTDVYNYQLDAWMIALKYDKKTVNGYSGNFPPDWGGLWQVNSPWYMNWVSDWVVQKQIPVDGFYVYDTTWQRWEPFLEFAPLAY